MKSKQVTKREWLEAGPEGQKRAEEKRVSRWPQELTENDDAAFSPTGEKIHGGSICKRVKPNKGHLERKVAHKKKGNK